MTSTAECSPTWTQVTFKCPRCGAETPIVVKEGGSVAQIDRRLLIELADEIEKPLCAPQKKIEEIHSGWARLIREAVGA